MSQQPYAGEKARLYYFLKNAIEAAAENTPFYQAQLRYTHFEYTKEEEYGICLSNTVGQPGCGPADEYREFNVRIIVTAYCRIPSAERDERIEADAKAYLLAMAVAKLIDEQPDLGTGSVGCLNSSRIGKLIGDVDDTLAAGQKHAVYNLYVTINHDGRPLPEPWDMN